LITGGRSELFSFDIYFYIDCSFDFEGSGEMKDMNDYYEEIDLSFEIYEILRKNYWTDWDRIISLVQDIIKNKEKIYKKGEK